MPRSSAAARSLTDHDEIRQWAEDRGARPSRVSGTGVAEDVGMIRLDFPGYSGGESLEEISWDDWFEKFEESNLAHLVQDRTAGGEQSNFNKLLSRDGAGERSRSSPGARTSARERAAGGSASSTSRRGRSTSARAKQSSGGRSSRPSANRRSANGRAKGRTTRSAAGKKG